MHSFSFLNIIIFTEENSPSLDLLDPDLEIDKEYDIQISNINQKNEFYILLLNKRHELINFQEKLNSEKFNNLDVNPKIGDLVVSKISTNGWIRNTERKSPVCHKTKSLMFFLLILGVNIII